MPDTVRPTAPTVFIRLNTTAAAKPVAHNGNNSGATIVAATAALVNTNNDLSGTNNSPYNPLTAKLLFPITEVIDPSGLFTNDCISGTLRLGNFANASDKELGVRSAGEFKMTCAGSKSRKALLPSLRSQKASYPTLAEITESVPTDCRKLFRAIVGPMSVLLPPTIDDTALPAVEIEKDPKFQDQTFEIDGIF